jgi:AMP-polyphosphate phosphotransferase
MDPRDYTVIPVGKPTDEEKQFHYLWRFWRRIPRDGRIAIFDRSWYGRVLVERVEGLCRPEEWKRAFREINDFERQLAEHGTIVLKYWLQISHEEQLDRFRQREATPHKRYKMTPEDWRNRRKRRAYEIAVGDMIELTNPSSAPWHLVAANDKKFARVEVLRSAAQSIQAALGT